MRQQLTWEQIEVGYTGAKRPTTGLLAIGRGGRAEVLFGPHAGLVLYRTLNFSYLRAPSGIQILILLTRLAPVSEWCKIAPNVQDEKQERPLSKAPGKPEGQRRKRSQEKDAQPVCVYVQQGPLHLRPKFICITACTHQVYIYVVI